MTDGTESILDSTGPMEETGITGDARSRGMRRP